MMHSYVGWHNRAVDYYLAARILYAAGRLGPAAFCGYQAVELMLKAALKHHDPDFSPQAAGHALAKLARMVSNRVRVRPAIRVPRYLYHEKRFLEVTRYPRSGRGVLVPSSFLVDLDRLMYELAQIMPARKNTLLGRAAIGMDSSGYSALSKSNQHLHDFKALFGV